MVNLKNKITIFNVKEETEEEKANIFKNNNVFAYILNNKLRKINFNIKTRTMLATFLNGNESLIIQKITEEDFWQIIARIKDTMRMDMADRYSNVEQEWNVEFDSYIHPTPFVCTQTRDCVTIGLKKIETIINI